VVTLYGYKIGRVELEERIGDISQVAGLTQFNLGDGPERSVRCILLRTGTLSATIVVDRGLDIANLEYRGLPLAWISPTGITSPAFYEPEGLGWLRGFYGGALTTCGLTYMGRPTVDEGEELGLHGRASYVPARLAVCRGRWVGDDYIMEVEGEVREARVFEPYISLYRRIEARLGESRLAIIDTVKNNGWHRQPFMILYHFNFGYPLLDAGSRLLVTSRLMVPRDSEAAEGAEEFDLISAPLKGFREKVYFHAPLPDSEGYAYAALVNEKLLGGLAVVIKFKVASLNRLVQWKMMGEGTYVLGIEPSNALVLGRDAERRFGTLQYLEPRESRVMELELAVLEGVEEIRRLERLINEIRGATAPRILRTIEEFIELARQ